jgi:hypothetical protein
MTETPNFVFGVGAEEAEEAAKEMGGGVGFRRTYIPKIGKGNHIFLRYISDHHQWIYATCHPSVPTKPAPSDWPKDKKWPKNVSATCRRDKAFGGYYKDCYPEDSGLRDEWGKALSPKVRIWAVAVLREEVICTPEHITAGVTNAYGQPLTQADVGKRIGFTDAIRTVLVPDLDANGKEQYDDKGKMKTKEIQEIALVLVNKAMNNWFVHAKSLVPIYGGTICANDFAILETNEGADVEWGHQSVNDTHGTHQPGTPSWQRYEQARIDQGLTDADIMKMIADKASDDFFAKYVDPTKPQPSYAQMSGRAAGQTGQQGQTGVQVPDGMGQPVNGQSAQAQAVAQAASNDVNEDTLAKMRARLQPGGAAPATPEQAPQTEQASSPEQATSEPPTQAATPDASQQASQPVASGHPACLVLPN